MMDLQGSPHPPSTACHPTFDPNRCPLYHEIKPIAGQYIPEPLGIQHSIQSDFSGSLPSYGLFGDKAQNPHRISRDPKPQFTVHNVHRVAVGIVKPYVYPHCRLSFTQAAEIRNGHTADLKIFRLKTSRTGHGQQTQ